MTIANKGLGIALAGALALTATTAFAQSSRDWAAAGAGFAAGAVVGSTMAPAYGPAYSYAPGYDAYAAAPDAYIVTGPAYRMPSQYGNYDSGFKSCATDGQYNRTNYSAC